MSEDRPTSTPYRRNGRPVACTPCRNRKVACDHTHPVCKRCQKRKQGSQCRYPDVTTSGTSSASPLSPPQESIRHLSLGSNLTDLPPATSLSDDAPGVTHHRPSSTQVAGSVYYGYTSHNNVLDETETSLALLEGTASAATPFSPSRRGQTGAALSALGAGIGTGIAGSWPPTTQDEPYTCSLVSFRSLPIPLRQKCLLVLRCLPGQSNEQIGYRETDNRQAGPKWWTYVAVERIVRSLQVTFGEVLTKGGDRGLEAMSQIICSNTTKPMDDDCSTLDEWIDQLCGRNLRWESLGLLWAHLARVSDIMDALRPRSLEWIGEQSLEMARTCLEYCCSLARYLNNGNLLLVDLCKRLTTLISIVDGEVGMGINAAHGTTVTMSTCLGMHVLENEEPYEPTLCSEYKRRLFAQIYHSDKVGVSYTGTPPLISRRYCSTPLPLDIGDDDLASDRETIMKAVYALDDQGWNTQGNVHSATVIRARSMLSNIREELLEIALGKNVFVTTDQLLNIKARQHATVSSFPSGLTYNAQDLDKLHPSGASNQVPYIRIVLHLDHLHNLFFAERLLLRHGEVNHGDLLATSYEMVCVTLQVWIHKDRFAYEPMLRNSDWLVMAYGVPGGGILCQELLYPTFTQVHPKHSGLTRSSLVQQLSLLVGFLDWVRPSAPNGAACADSKAIIQRVLDHHLNAAAAGVVGRGANVATNANGDGNGSGGHHFAESMDWGAMSQPDFNFDLLDTFDWMRTEA